MTEFHKIKITNDRPDGLPVGTQVELDGKPLSLIQKVEVHQAANDFTTVHLTLIGKIELVTDGVLVYLVTEDGRKYLVREVIK